MTLDQFLAWKGLTNAAFADEIGVTPVSVGRYRSGERRPNWGILARIRDATGGVVTADSFMPQPSKRRKAS